MSTAQLGAVTVAASFPVVTTAVGAGFTAIRPPSLAVRSAIQHFAAGVVFSVVAVELLPDITRIHSIPEVVVDFALGIVLMLTVRKLTASGEKTVPEEALSEDDKQSAGEGESNAAST